MNKVYDGFDDSDTKQDETTIDDNGLRLRQISELNYLKRALYLTRLMILTSVISLSLLWYFYGLPNSLLSELEMGPLHLRLLLLMVTVPLLCLMLNFSVKEWVKLTKSIKQINKSNLIKEIRQS